jgi:hypothetical protein
MIVRALSSVLATLLVVGCALQRPEESAFGTIPRAYQQASEDAVLNLLANSWAVPHKVPPQILRVDPPVRAYQNEVRELGGRLLWSGWMTAVTCKVKNRVGYWNTDVFYVQFDGDSVHSVTGANLTSVNISLF